MKTIKLGDNTFNFEDVIRAKHMRKIYPLTKKMAGNEIDTTIDIAKILLIDINGSVDMTKNSEIIDNLEMKDFTKLMEEVGGLMNDESKKK